MSKEEKRVAELREFYKSHKAEPEVYKMPGKHMALGSDIPMHLRSKFLIESPHSALDEKEEKKEKKEDKKEEKKEKKKEEKKEEKEEKEEPKLTRAERKAETKKYGYKTKMELMKEARKAEKYMR